MSRKVRYKNTLNITSIITLTQNWIWIFTFFLIPLFFATYSFRVFEFQKSLILRGLVFFMIFLQFVKIFLPKEKIQRSPSKNLKVIFYATAFFLGIKIVSDVVGYSPTISFWGDSFRPDGILTLISTIFFTVFGVLVLKDEDFKKYFLWVFQIQIFLISLYGMIQLVNLDWIGWAENAFDGRVFSTLGQPNFLGGYYTLAIPFLLYIFTITKNKTEKYFSLFNLGFLVLPMIATRSRSAWIGAFVSISLFSLVYLIQKRKAKLISAFGISLLSLASGLFVFSKMPEVKPEGDVGETLNRVQNIYQWKAGSGAIRVEYWKKAIEFTQEKLVLGWGDETFQRVIRTDFPEKIAWFGSFEIPDKPHNFFLETVYESGILGLSTYIFIWALIFYAGIKQGKKENLPLLFSFFGYFIYLFFSFETVGNSVLLFGIVALILSDLVSENILDKKTRFNQKTNPASLLIFSFVGFFIFVIFQVSTVINPLRADKNFHNYSPESIQSALLEIEKIEKIDPLDPLYTKEKLKILSTISYYDTNKKNLINYYEEAQKSSEKLEGTLGENFDSYYYLGEVCSRIYETTGEERYGKCAVENLKKAQKFKISI